MHPPFHFVDHKIGPDIHHQGDTKPVTRRSLPTRLRLSAAATGWPPVPLPVTEPDIAPAPHWPSGARTDRPSRLHVVPPPKGDIRDIIGRWLIRIGQRMILESRG